MVGFGAALAALPGGGTASAPEGFILLSAGKDGIVGTDDDLWVTGRGEAVKGRANLASLGLGPSDLIPSSAQAGRVELSVDRPVAPADGRTAVTITARAFDRYGRPVPDGTEVAFSATLGVLSAGSAATSGGAASVALVSSEPGEALVTATVGSVSSSVQVVFEPVELDVNQVDELRAVLAAGKKIVYVDAARGSDSNDGLSPETPVKTINRAVTLCNNGDGIFVRKGVYREKSSVTYWGQPKRTNVWIDKSVVIVGEDIDETVLLVDGANVLSGGGEYYFLTFAAPNVKVKNFTMKYAAAPTYRMFSIWGIWEGWDGRRAYNSTLENVVVLVEGPVSAVYYLNDFNFLVKNNTVKAKGRASQLIYWNYGSITFDRDIFDVGYQAGSQTGTYWNVSPDIFINYAGGNLRLKPEYEGVYQAGAFRGTYYDDGQKVVNP